eukprot:1178818-Prorocentrum_minimum.AAC.4
MLTHTFSLRSSHVVETQALGRCILGASSRSSENVVAHKGCATLLWSARILFTRCRPWRAKRVGFTTRKIACSSSERKGRTGDLSAVEPASILKTKSDDSNRPVITLKQLRASKGPHTQPYLNETTLRHNTSQCDLQTWWGLYISAGGRVHQ